MKTKKFISLFLAVSLSLPLFSHGRVRGKINIPDLEGFVTLKCDFHMHTVFSDGTVWPTTRVNEAYGEGLHAISITDHIEFRPHITRDLVPSHNRGYEIAKPRAEERGIILIKGAEITHRMPPGHLNAIFLTDANELDTPNYMDALRAAKAQGAFIFWNHPCWDAQQPDTVKWFDTHTRILQEGMMHGIEVVNGADRYCPEAHRWALEKNLTMIGTSDIHAPMPLAPGEHRSMTLVFARTATAEGIREALIERRTAVYHNHTIIGREEHLKELFENALEITTERTGNTVLITFRNKSDLPFHLKRVDDYDRRLVYFRHLYIVPNGIQTATVRLTDGITDGEVSFFVENFWVAPNQGMRYVIRI